MTPEEQIIQRYFDAFNRHDLDGVMACFDPQIVLVDAAGRRTAGHAAVRAHYLREFELFPDGRCDLRSCTGNSGRGMAESFFHGTLNSDRRRVEAIGAEVMEMAGGLIKEIRDYHRVLNQDQTSSRAA